MEDILMMGSFRCTFEKGTIPYTILHPPSLHTCPYLKFSWVSVTMDYAEPTEAV